MARNKICENTLQLQSKGMERKLHNRLHILSSQSSQLRQKMKVLNMEKQKADLEIKKRYFPGHDFHQDETQLQTSMRQLILQCNQFYLNKKQRYPIRASVKEYRINSASCSSSSNSGSKKRVPVESDDYKRSKSECSNRRPQSKETDPTVVPKSKENRNSDSGSDRSRTLPEILLPARKKEKHAQSMGMKCTQNLARFSVLLSTEKDGWEDDSDRLPAIRHKAEDPSQSPASRSWLEDYDEEFDTSLPNIDLREIFSNTNLKTFTDAKSKTIPGDCSLQQSSKRGHRVDQSHFQNLLELESTRLNWKIHNYFLKDKGAHTKSKSVETSELDYSQVDNSSPSISEESFRIYREREALNTVPRDVKLIRQDHNWRLTTPVDKSENFVDNLTVIMRTGMAGMSCQNVSFIPLNSARRALRHTPTFKMQQFLKQMMAQCTQAQQFEVNKLQTEFEVTTPGETDGKPTEGNPADQPIVNMDPELVQKKKEDEERDILGDLETQDAKVSDQNVKTGEFG